MGDMRVAFDDGSVVRLYLASAGEDKSSATAVDHSADHRDPTSELDLPPGFGTARPVSVDGRASQALTRGGTALADALRPLGGVLASIHRSLSDIPHRPDEVTVEFGVTLGSDLSLGVFSGTGEASFTVSATWNLHDARQSAVDPVDPGVASATGA
ncbi:CU044_2847 family protein [Streptomyces virginiae]|uniref:CU044_2847 family protein n=1 Tax=Streptomyces virginiae TaxID=1961 RepID=UPI0036ADB04B